MKSFFHGQKTGKVFFSLKNSKATGKRINGEEELFLKKSFFFEKKDQVCQKKQTQYIDNPHQITWLFETLIGLLCVTSLGVLIGL